jgi:hypothetical protein
MKFLTKNADLVYLQILKDLMDTNCEPAVVMGENTARMFKSSSHPDAIRLGMRVWMVIVPLIVVVVFIAPATFRFTKAIHALLFLATGAAIGFTFGSLFGDEYPLIAGELAWLLLGVAAAVLHY